MTVKRKTSRSPTSVESHGFRRKARNFIRRHKEKILGDWHAHFSK